MDQTTPTSGTRTGIIGPDGDISTLTTIVCQGDTGVRVGASCTKAGETLTGRMVFRDASGNFLGMSASTTFTSDGTAWFSVAYLATPEPDAWYPLCGPSQVAFHVDTVSGGSWTLYEVAQ